MRTLPQGPPFNSHSGHHDGATFNNRQQWHGPGLENTHSRPLNLCTQDSDGQATRGLVPSRSQGTCGEQSRIPAYRDSRGGGGSSRHDYEATLAATTPSTLGRSHPHPTSSTYTTPGPGTLHDHCDSTLEQMQSQQTDNRPTSLSIPSSKSSPPYTSSQRKQLRVEEKSYLKEVKRSIAEGRVPKVRLTQNNHGDIMQYKAQFLNALKLAALAIEPNADIDVHNPATMQEIMKEVRRQFIIEKPLPEGMVAGFLQRLYKRNRSLYHRH